MSNHKLQTRDYRPETKDQKSKERCDGRLLLAGLWSLVFGLVFTGCAVWKPLPFQQIEPPALPEKYTTYYDYPSANPEVKILTEKPIQHYRFKRVEFELSLPEDLRIKNLEEYKKQTEELFQTDEKTARDRKLRYVSRIDYYVPRDLKPGEKRPAILISPILGGNMVVDGFASYYAGRGYVAAIVHRKKLYWEDDEDITQVEKYMRTSVIRLRQAVDWLEKQPEVDPRRIGSFGISYGAILHSMLAAVEPRIRYHVLAMPAGPIPEVIVHCPDKMISKLVKAVHEKYGWSHKKIQEDLEKTIQTDPIHLASYVPKQKVTYYVALFDRVVGANRSFRLWKAMGKPDLKILPFGHYGGILVFPYLQSQSYAAFKKHLKPLPIPRN